MKIGLASDTHGNVRSLMAAMKVLADRGVQAVVHCGDIGSSSCLETLAEPGIAAYAVAGNIDGPDSDLEAAAHRCGVHFARDFVTVPIQAQQYLVATHGHRDHLLAELIAGGQFPYVCHGHTHRRRDERIGPVRVINPGALHRAAIYTVAVLDTETDHLETIEIRP